MKLIVGLGNPELRYVNTRHNAGYWLVDRLATAYGAHYSHAKDMFSDFAKVNIGGQSVILAKPTTYMNLSGRAVQALVHWYKMELEDCLVLHDDVSLPLGRLRLQNGGGAGGQHGIESIIQMLSGAKNFHRLKFGVGPDPGGARRADYVLSAIPEPQQQLKEEILKVATDAIHCWLSDGVTAAANKFNGIDLRPPDPVAPPVEPEPI